MERDVETNRTSFDDLVTNGIQQILLSFGKGEDLRSAVWAIVVSTCNWCDKQDKNQLGSKGSDTNG